MREVNDVLAFQGIFKRALAVRATDINTEMKLAAIKALAESIKDEGLNESYIIPDVFDTRVADLIAQAVDQAAKNTGVARI